MIENYYFGLDMADNPLVSLFDIASGRGMRSPSQTNGHSPLDNKYGGEGVSKYEFLSTWRKEPWGINLVVGKSGGGKTALCVRLSEFLNRATYAVNMLKVPVWITPIAKLHIEEDDVNYNCYFVFPDGSTTPADKGSTVIIDDAANILESNKMYTDANETIKKLSFIARHLDICFLINVQDASSLNKQVVGQTRALFFKEPALFQMSTDRDFIGKLIEEKVRPFFDSLNKSERKLYTYIVHQDFRGVIKTGLAKGWTTAISKNKG